MVFLKETLYVNWRKMSIKSEIDFFFLNSRFFSFYFTVLSCSNLMLMSLSLGLSTLVFLATLGTLNCCVFRQQPDLMWSLILGLLALPGSPTRSCDLFSALYLCSFLLLHVPWETSFCLLSYFLVIFKVLPWRAQVPEMGCHWMEVAIAALGLLRSRTEIRNPSSRLNSGHCDKNQQKLF